MRYKLTIRYAWRNLQGPHQETDFHGVWLADLFDALWKSWNKGKQAPWWSNLLQRPRVYFFAHVICNIVEGILFSQSCDPEILGRQHNHNLDFHCSSSTPWFTTKFQIRENQICTNTPYYSIKYNHMHLLHNELKSSKKFQNTYEMSICAHIQWNRAWQI